MAEDFRLPHDRVPGGGRVDRDRPLRFAFNDVTYTGLAGDTLASALLANGVRLVARSFKYHRPRGIFGAGVEDPSAIVQVGTGARATPNRQATAIELFDGIEARSVNCWPGPRFDVMAVNGLFARFLPAGFYYKTFMAPASLWPLYERVIRRAAGLGRAPAVPDADVYDKMTQHVDVLVVGGGPAGLAAALAAGRAGARVILADQQRELGGRLLDDRHEIDGRPALYWVAAAVAELARLPEVRVLIRTTAFGYYDHNYVCLVERCTDHLPPPQPGARQRLWKVRARQVVLATGAIERPLAFADNDRPGVMLASAARAYANRYGVAPGRRVAVFTNNDDAYRTALDLADAGVAVAQVVDVRRDPAGELPMKAMERGIEVVDAAAVVAVRGAHGVRGIEVMSLDESGTALSGETRAIACDALCVSGGWSPAVHLSAQSGARPRFDEAAGAFRPGDPVQAERSAGAAAGTFALGDCLAEGFAAGREAARAAGFADAGEAIVPAASDPDEQAPRRLWIVPGQPPGERGEKHFVDLHNDVTVADLRLAVREGYESAEHAKRYTTLGMGPDQGKTGNVLGLAVLAEATGAGMTGAVTTTFRPPFTPVTFGALAGRDVGRLADPVRRTPMHHWHDRAGVAFEGVNQWRRPHYYPKPGESMREAVMRECLAVRNVVGILDASTLGKIDIRGPDAVVLLNRVYTNDWDKLAVGRCRYGLMLGEDGMVFEDGVTARLGEHHYLMTTTTGGADRVMRWLEEWRQCEWPDLRVYLTSVTERYATITLCGPGARGLLQEFTDNIDLGRDAFPFMTVREGRVAGIPARVFRVSYTGELSYEINVEAGAGHALWTRLMVAAEKHGITPFGTETMRVLRAEKGYIIVGQETDRTVTPVDLGLERMVSKRKDFIGKRSLSRADFSRADRKQLVCLLPEDPNEVLPEGVQLVAEPKAKPPMAMVGHVTSSYYSANLGRSFALALVKGGRARLGETLVAPLPNRSVRVKVAHASLFDPGGTRLHG